MLDPLSLSLVMIAGLFLLGAAGEMIFARTQIPDVVWLILAGVLLNATGLVDPDALDGILPLFAALTLIIVLFEGGSQLVISELVKSAPRATILAILSFTLSTIFIAVLTMGASAVGMLPEGWNFTHGLMVGAMLGGSSSLIVMPSMTLAKVEEKVANLVGLESALTDALCVVVTVAMINILAPGAGDAAGSSSAAVTLAKNFGIALAVGVAAGWVWMPIMARLRGSPHAYPVTLAALLVLYVVVDKMGGSAAMGILAFAIIVGNADALMKMVGFRADGDGPVELDYEVRTVHTQISFIIKSFFFTFIGLKLTPPWSLLAAGVVFGFGLLVARVPAVIAVTRGAFEHKDRQLITVSFPRGMAAGVLATLPAQAGVAGTEKLPSLVFAAVVTSIGIFAFGFKKIRSGAPPAKADAKDSAAGGPEAQTPVDGTPTPAAVSGTQPSEIPTLAEAAAPGVQGPAPAALAAQATGAPAPETPTPPLGAPAALIADPAMPPPPGLAPLGPAPGGATGPSTGSSTGSATGPRTTTLTGQPAPQAPAPQAPAPQAPAPQAPAPPAPGPGPNNGSNGQS